MGVLMGVDKASAKAFSASRSSARTASTSFSGSGASIARASASCESSSDFWSGRSSASLFTSASTVTALFSSAMASLRSSASMEMFCTALMALQSRVTSNGTFIAASSSLRDLVKFASTASASSITASVTPIWRASLISLFTARMSTTPEWKALTSCETSPVFSCTALRSSFADWTACASMPALLASSMHRCNVSAGPARGPRR